MKTIREYLINYFRVGSFPRYKYGRLRGKIMNDPNRAAFSMAICTLSEERRKKALAKYDRSQKELEELIRSLALEDDQQSDSKGQS